MEPSPDTELDPRLWPIYLAELISQPGADIPDLRHLMAPGYQPAWHLVPDRGNAAVIAHGKFRANVSLPVGSYVWAFGAYSQQADGFKVQIIDMGTGSPFFSGALPHSVLSGQTVVAGVTFPLHVLHKPRLVIEPAVLSVEIQNDSGSANQIQFVLFTAEPREEPRK